MGSFESAETSERRGGQPGKIDSPLNEKLKNVKWGEFRIGDIFEKLSVKKANPKDVQEYKDSIYCIPVVYCKFGDNGIMYWGKENDFTTYENVISIVYNGVIAAGKVYAQKSKTGILAESYFIKIKNRETTHNINLFLSSILEKTLYPKYSRDFLATWTNRVENDYIQLPLKEKSLDFSNPCDNIKNIDFDFMESFIREIEAERMRELEEERIRELNAYLQTTGLKDYALTAAEQKVLEEFEHVKWGKFRLGDLFEIKNTLGFNADKLVSGNEYDYVTRTSLNQGILHTTGFVNQENLNDSGIWSLGLLQMDFFYRRKPWYAGQFVRKIIPKFKLSENTILYFSTLLNMQKKKLLSVLVRNVDATFRNLFLSLPITSSGEIDFDFMETFIKAIEKLVIKDVVQYADKRIAATAQMVK